LIARGFCFRKIHRRKAKTWRFFLGKSEKLRFRRAITDRPYILKRKQRSSTD
jgi:hypothetical protein